jgi:hypothetical protein
MIDTIKNTFYGMGLGMGLFIGITRIYVFPEPGTDIMRFYSALSVLLIGFAAVLDILSRPGRQEDPEKWGWLYKRFSSRGEGEALNYVSHANGTDWVLNQYESRWTICRAHDWTNEITVTTGQLTKQDLQWINLYISQSLLSK